MACLFVWLRLRAHGLQIDQNCQTALGLHLPVLGSEALEPAVLGHVLDADHLEAPLLGELPEVIAAGHLAIVEHNFREDAGRIESGELAEV